MPEYSDIYVISDKRDEKTVEDFLNCFLPDREESADEYEIPQFSESPDVVYSKALELVKYCSANQRAEYAAYWRAVNQGKPEHAMVFYLKDGHVIYGLSTDAGDEAFANGLLAELKAFLGAEFGYIGHEASPDAADLPEFMREMENHQRCNVGG
ncbi:hypothetical protein A6D6_01936 [Alcanivorax xiamenensis]|uniref:Uncharacterized protein n=1 Tax=Alcanivorax xiamenensis TaxID=1177156 RepID=A0ABQ6Y8T2_9GAMM|nr:hypothetical protein [Alcanivorax xiamenensis]KAF0805880.1 hypothetical protein A6D6_01936 [Alcanivorax xiamenensis]